MSKLNQTAFVIRDGAVVETTYADLDRYVETSTRPTGVGTKHYVTTDSNDQWCVAVWVTWAGPEHILSRHESEEEAIAAVEEIWIRQIDDNNEEGVYSSREQAEQVLADSLEE